MENFPWGIVIVGVPAALLIVQFIAHIRSTKADMRHDQAKTTPDRDYSHADPPNDAEK